MDGYEYEWMTRVEAKLDYLIKALAPPKKEQEKR